MAKLGTVAMAGHPSTDEIRLRQLALRILYSPGQLVRVVRSVVGHIC
jgi:hypothetical protein